LSLEEKFNPNDTISVNLFTKLSYQAHITTKTRQLSNDEFFKINLMKSIIVIFSFLFSITVLNAQQQFSVPQITPEQKHEILYNHVIAYAVTGIGFAKTKGATPEEFGKYIGTHFKPFWNPNDGFPAFTNGMLLIMGGMHPDHELQIIEQSEKMILFKLKNVDYSFQNGPVFGITYNEFLACSNEIISTLAEHMNVSFTSKTENGWYMVELVKK
jgi:hypothetical protein